MDTIIIVLVFVSWLLAYRVAEYFWKGKQVPKLILVIMFSFYMVLTYLLGFELTKLV